MNQIIIHFKNYVDINQILFSKESMLIELEGKNIIKDQNKYN